MALPEEPGLDEFDEFEAALNGTQQIRLAMRPALQQTRLNHFLCGSAYWMLGHEATI